MHPHQYSNIASELEGTLLLSVDLFPYFLLVAVEAGGPLRAAALLAVYPLASLLSVVLHEDLALLAMAFVSTTGLAVDDVNAVSKATLPRFFLQDLRESAFRAFSRHAGRKLVVTRLPSVLAEPFLREYLDADRVVGMELRTVGRRFSGIVASPCAAAIEDDQFIGVGLCSGIDGQKPFWQMCQERRVVCTPEKASASATPLPRSEYPRPLIFHDGRLVGRPDTVAFLVILLWLPLGVLLAVTRILIGILLPSAAGLLVAAASGFQIRAQVDTAALPTAGTGAGANHGTLYACNHQTLLDPVILSTVVGRKVSAVTYTLSGFSELISPISTVRLTRDRARDRAVMQSLLARGDLVVCPEGTTCREPYLLRFSPLFAEVSRCVTPVAVRAGGTMFYGTTVRGYKWLDSFFFLTNPAPWYELRLLAPVPGAADGEASYEVANRIQRSIGRVIGFECTGLTRKDKYRMLAGHDGVDARCR